MTNLAELRETQAAKLAEITLKDRRHRYRILVGMATCGIAAGAKPVMKALQDALRARGISDVPVVLTGCVGVCRLEPIVEVIDPIGHKSTYVLMTPEKARRVVDEHIAGGTAAVDLLLGAGEDASYDTMEDAPFFRKQKRVALRNCGAIDPESIDEAIAAGAYQALGKALTTMLPHEVIEEVKRSGLRGRGGAGFTTGMKWEFAAKSVDDRKFVCCNADEGDPGAFMDRSLLEGDPHAVLEAMAIAGYAIGSDQGYIYVRAEYPTAVKRLGIAIRQAKERGLLGANILGTPFSFDLEIRLGAGAFVCGEETALMTSIEGKRGEPRPRPPFPAVKGLWQKPTILNNVETYANIAPILLNGADWFAATGTKKSKGTKVFAVGGRINNTGLVEIPMGTTLREVVYEIGGGIPNGKKFKAAQTGGPSGGCIPASLIDTPMDYDSLIEIGSMMGSGGLIVMDETTCMVDIARFFLDFTVDESCGKCPPCRIGTKRMLEILDRITTGKGEDGDIEKLETLARNIKASALCGLGQSAPNPVLTTLRYFRNEYEAHIREKRCPAGVCKALFNYKVVAEKCKGCGLCAKNCPAACIAGERRQPYAIDADRCVKCGVCVDACPFKAIVKEA